MFGVTFLFENFDPAMAIIGFKALLDMPRLMAEKL